MCYFAPSHPERSLFRAQGAPDGIQSTEMYANMDSLEAALARRNLSTLY